MAELPLDQAIPRFKSNEDRVDRFANGGDTVSWVTSTGVSVPSLRKFLKDKDDAINTEANGILADSVAARDAAQGYAGSASTDANRAETAREEAEQLVTDYAPLAERVTTVEEKVTELESASTSAIFGTRALVEAATIPATTPGIVVVDPDVGTPYSLKRQTAVPGHDGYIRSADLAYWEVNGRRVTLEMFRRGGADDATAFNRASTYLQSKGGGVLDLLGRSYQFNSPITLDASFVTLDARGAALYFPHNTAAGLDLGGGATPRHEVAVYGGYWTQAGTSVQSLLRIRNLRTLRTHHVRADNLYTFAEWGTAFDTAASYEWFEFGTEVNMRPNTDASGHSHIYIIRNSNGGWYQVACITEGNAEKSSPPAATQSSRGVWFRPDFMPARFDHWERSGGLIKGLGIGVSIDQCRVVNVEWSKNCRVDDTQFYAVVVDAGSADDGLDNCTFHYRVGGFPKGRAFYMPVTHATADIRGLNLDISTNELRGDIIEIAQTGGNVKGIKIALDAINYKPDALNGRNAVLLSGTMSQIVIPSVLVDVGNDNGLAYGVNKTTNVTGIQTGIIQVSAGTARSW